MQCRNDILKIDYSSSKLKFYGAEDLGKLKEVKIVKFYLKCTCGGVERLENLFYATL